MTFLHISKCVSHNCNWSSLLPQKQAICTPEKTIRNIFTEYAACDIKSNSDDLEKIKQRKLQIIIRNNYMQASILKNTKVMETLHHLLQFFKENNIFKDIDVLLKTDFDPLWQIKTIYLNRIQKSGDISKKLKNKERLGYDATHNIDTIGRNIFLTYRIVEKLERSPAFFKPSLLESAIVNFKKIELKIFNEEMEEIPDYDKIFYILILLSRDQTLKKIVETKLREQGISNKISSGDYYFDIESLFATVAEKKRHLVDINVLFHILTNYVIEHQLKIGFTNLSKKVYPKPVVHPPNTANPAGNFSLKKTEYDFEEFCPSFGGFSPYSPPSKVDSSERIEKLFSADCSAGTPAPMIKSEIKKTDNLFHSPLANITQIEREIKEPSLITYIERLAVKTLLPYKYRLILLPIFIEQAEMQQKIETKHEELVKLLQWVYRSSESLSIFQLECTNFGIKIHQYVSSLRERQSEPLLKNTLSSISKGLLDDKSLKAALGDLNSKCVFFIRQMTLQDIDKRLTDEDEKFTKSIKHFFSNRAASAELLRKKVSSPKKIEIEHTSTKQMAPAVPAEQSSKPPQLGQNSTIPSSISRREKSPAGITGMTPPQSPSPSLTVNSGIESAEEESFFDTESYEAVSPVREKISHHPEEKTDFPKIFRNKTFTSSTKSTAQRRVFFSTGDISPQVYSSMPSLFNHRNKGGTPLSKESSLRNIIFPKENSEEKVTYHKKSSDKEEKICAPAVPAEQPPENGFSDLSEKSTFEGEEQSSKPPQLGQNSTKASTTSPRKESSAGIAACASSINPSITEFINNITDYIAYEILSTKNSKQATEIFQNWIAFANMAIESKTPNLFIAHLIYAALQKNSISRISKRIELKPSYSKMLKYLDELFSPLSNFANSRAFCLKSTYPVIPYIGIYKRPLISTLEKIEPLENYEEELESDRKRLEEKKGKLVDSEDITLYEAKISEVDERLKAIELQKKKHHHHKSQLCHELLKMQQLVKLAYPLPPEKTDCLQTILKGAIAIEKPPIQIDPVSNEKKKELTKKEWDALSREEQIYFYSTFHWS